MIKLQYIRAAFFGIVLMSMMPLASFGHGIPLFISVSNQKLTASPSIYFDPEDGSLERITISTPPGIIAVTDLPGLTITSMNIGDELGFQFLPRALSSNPTDERYLWYWKNDLDGISIAPHNATLTISADTSASAPQSLLPNPGSLKIATIDSFNLGSHSHLLNYYVANDPITTEPSIGIYGVYGQFTSPQYQSSDPVWLMFKYGPFSEMQTDNAITAFTTQTTTTPSGASPVTWNVGSASWNTVSGNWTGGSPTASLYKEGDNVVFNNSAAGGTVTIQAGGVSPASTVVNNDLSHPYIFENAGTAGIKTGSLTKSGAGALTLDNINTYTGTTTVAGGLLTISPTGSIDSSSTIDVNAAGALLANHILTTNLTLDGSATIRANGGETGASKVVTFSIGAGGKLNLKDNDLVVGTAANVTAVRDQIKLGKTNNAPAGITSDAALFGSKTGFGYAMGNDPNLSMLLSGPSSLAGQSFDTNSVLVKYTFLGDADLDGDTDLNDLGKWASNFTGDLNNPAVPAKFWTQGDFDYDGDTDLNDLGKWSSNFTGDLNGGPGSLIVYAPGASAEAVAILGQMGIVVVPEPSMIGAIGVSALVALLTLARRK